jgi:hypothetical protein
MLQVSFRIWHFAVTGETTGRKSKTLFALTESKLNKDE